MRVGCPWVLEREVGNLLRGDRPPRDEGPCTIVALAGGKKETYPLETAAAAATVKLNYKDV